MKPETLKEYAELKIQEKQIKARIEELGPEIKQELLTQGVDKLPTSLGNFTIKKVKRWTYTEEVKVLDEQLKAQKTKEEADGSASFVEAAQLEFRETKEN